MPAPEQVAPEQVAPEQVAPEPASRSRLQQAAAWSVAALITLAAAISVLLSKTVAGATASATPARDGEALVSPPRSATAARSRPGSCASGDDRSCCPGRSQSPAHQAGTTISSSFRGQPPVVRRLLRGEYAAAARRDSQLQRYQVRVRGHLGETPGQAAPSPDGATLCRPRKPAFRPVTQQPLAMAGHLVTVSQYILLISTAPSLAGDYRTRQSRSAPCWRSSRGQA